MSPEPSFNLIEHLKERHLNIDLHKPILDFESNTCTFILYSFAGVLTGYQQYKPLSDKKPFNHPKLSRYYTYKSKSIVSVWGLESLIAFSGPIFICEGIFDAARFTEKGIAAIATLCNNPPDDYRNWLDCIPRKKIVICDNDAAGLKLKKISR